jgi:hypothetical protein
MSKVKVKEEEESVGVDSSSHSNINGNDFQIFSFPEGLSFSFDMIYDI